MATSVQRQKKPDRAAGLDMLQVDADYLILADLLKSYALNGILGPNGLLRFFLLVLNSLTELAFAAGVNVNGNVGYPVSYVPVMYESSPYWVRFTRNSILTTLYEAGVPSSSVHSSS